MTRSHYLSGKVKSFVDWMSAHLDSDMFAHAYRNRRSGKYWECNGLYDAYTKYDWEHPSITRLGVEKGRTFESNSKALAGLRKDLLKALESTRNDRDACEAAIDVMTWGGVRRGNVNWLLQNEVGLAALINDTRLALEAGDTKHPTLTSDKLRFNAGMTKVYSLVCDHFIIYDSRVAAALGWAVVKFCRAHGISPVPDELRFPWAPGYEAKNARDPKRRNPAEEFLAFPGLQSGALHAEWNLRANWLLNSIWEQDSAKNSNFYRITDTSTRLRALESALFMIGYDLPVASEGDVAVANRSPVVPTDGKNSASDEPADGWVRCETPARRKRFTYQIGVSGIETRGTGQNGYTQFSDEVVNDTLTRLANANEYSGQPFGLHNNAEDVRDGNAPWGLGMAYFGATKLKGNAPDTSRLAAVLEDVGAFERCQTKPHLAWRLNGELDVKERSVNIRPMLDRHLAREQEA